MDAAVPSGSVGAGDGQHLAALEGIAGVELGAPAPPGEIALLAAWTQQGQPVGIGMGHELAGEGVGAQGDGWRSLRGPWGLRLGHLWAGLAG